MPSPDAVMVARDLTAAFAFEARFARRKLGLNEFLCKRRWTRAGLTLGFTDATLFFVAGTPHQYY